MWNRTCTEVSDASGLPMKEPSGHLAHFFALIMIQIAFQGVNVDVMRKKGEGL